MPWRNGQKLYVGTYQNKNERKQAIYSYRQTRNNSNLFISNLDQSIDDQALRDAFAQYGTITSARVSEIFFWKAETMN